MAGPDHLMPIVSIPVTHEGILYVVDVERISICTTKEGDRRSLVLCEISGTILSKDVERMGVGRMHELGSRIFDAYTFGSITDMDPRTILPFNGQCYLRWDTLPQDIKAIFRRWFFR